MKVLTLISGGTLRMRRLDADRYGLGPILMAKGW